MAVNPHRKGGPDIPVADGGTGASAGVAALTNLGGLSTGDHASIDHTGIPGAGVSTKQGLFLPKGFPYITIMPRTNDATLSVIQGSHNPLVTSTSGTPSHSGMTGPFGIFARISTNAADNVSWTADDFDPPTSALGRAIFKCSGSASVSGSIDLRFGPASFAFSSASLNWRATGVTGGPFDTGVTAATVRYLVIEYTSSTVVSMRIYDTTFAENFAQNYNVTPGSGAPRIFVDDTDATLDFYGGIYSVGV